MKLFLCLLLLSALTGHCQLLSLPQPAPVHTAQLGEVARLGQLFQLPALPTLRDQRHLRFFRAGNVVDCWQTPAGNYQGQVVHWAREVVPSKEPGTGREFVLTQLLTAATVQALFTVLDSCQLLRVPDERAIPGWQRNILDGVSYTLEYQDAQTYQVATYGNPASQGQLPEAKQVTHFVERLYGLLHMAALNQLFTNAVPYEGFTDGSGISALRVTSYAQHLAYKRERQRYLRQQKQRSTPPSPTP